MKHERLTDQEIIALARDGRQSAFRELIDRYQRPVFSLTYRLVGDYELAEDLAQDTFIKVLNALDRYDPAYKFSSWIFKIAHNTALDALRRKQPTTYSLDGSPHADTPDEASATAFSVTSTDPTPAEHAEHRELSEAIERALATLRPEYRTAITLYHLEGQSYEEIARIMDLPLGTVKTFIYRGRRELRVHLAHLRC